MKVPTRAQSEVLEAARRLHRELGTAPSHSQLASELGYRSKGTVAKHVARLRELGLLRADLLLPHDAVTIGAAGDWDTLVLAVVGRVAAGCPIAEGGAEREVAVSRQLFRPEPAYLLEVRGDSMIDAGILDGDLIAVHPCTSADHGQLVVARVGEELTVKQLHIRDGAVTLKSCNAAYGPIVPDAADDFAIVGRYCGLVRVV